MAASVRQQHGLYFDGCLQESRNRQNLLTPSLMTTARFAEPVSEPTPAFDLFEVTMASCAPARAFPEPGSASLRDVATDIIAWINDIVSYQKESSFNDPHNLISVLMADCGLTQPEAATKTVDYINEQLDGFMALATKVRGSMGPAGNEYIDGLENWIRGVYDWSFTSERYSADYLLLSQEASHLLVN